MSAHSTKVRRALGEVGCSDSFVDYVGDLAESWGPRHARAPSGGSIDIRVVKSTTLVVERCDQDLDNSFVVAVKRRRRRRTHGHVVDSRGERIAHLPAWSIAVICPHEIRAQVARALDALRQLGLGGYAREVDGADLVLVHCSMCDSREAEGRTAVVLPLARRDGTPLGARRLERWLVTTIRDEETRRTEQRPANAPE